MQVSDVSSAPDALARRLARNLAHVRDRIAAAAARSARPPEAVRLVAVTKYVGPAEIAALRSQSQQTRRATVPALEEILYDAIPLLDHGFVRVIDYMGDDAAIVQAARVSYGRGTKQVSGDRGLINYLMRHRHTSPFEMCELKLHVKLPIFVARQWIRHRTANVNEYSARYSVLDREFYIPDKDLLKLVKPSRKEEPVQERLFALPGAAHTAAQSVASEASAIQGGVADSPVVYRPKPSMLPLCSSEPAADRSTWRYWYFRPIASNARSSCARVSHGGMPVNSALPTRSFHFLYLPWSRTCTARPMSVV